jgi:hypothetical protein
VDLRLISFAGSVSAITYSGDRPAQIVDFLYRHTAPTGNKDNGEIENTLHPYPSYRLLAGSMSDDLTLHRGDTLLYQGNSLPLVTELLLGDMAHYLTAQSHSGLVFHAAAVALNKRGLLLPGLSGAGKSTLVAWLLCQGFDYLTDELVFIPWGSVTMQGFTRPLNLKAPLWSILPVGLNLAQPAGQILTTPHTDLVQPTLFRPDNTAGEVTLAQIVFPSYQSGSELALQSISGARAGLGLMECLLNARNLPEHGLSETGRLARQIPAYQLRYGHCSQLEQWLETLPGHGEASQVIDGGRILL